MRGGAFPHLLLSRHRPGERPAASPAPAPAPAAATTSWHATVLHRRVTIAPVSSPPYALDATHGPMQALHKAKPTGYDMHGLLCAKLNAGDRKKIFKAREAKAAEARMTGPGGEPVISPNPHTSVYSWYGFYQEGWGAGGAVRSALGW